MGNEFERISSMRSRVAASARVLFVHDPPCDKGNPTRPTRAPSSQAQAPNAILGVERQARAGQTPQHATSKSVTGLRPPMPIRVTRLEHLGIAVADLDRASRFFTDVLGLPVSKHETVDEQMVRIAFHPVGEVKLELLATTRPEGPIGRHIEKRGEGIQHVAFHVADIDEAIAHVRAKGVRTLTETWSIGAEKARIIFLHPKDTPGMLVELVQLPG
jgi:methylmalonyl-CoA/ethylmalonyl-CoA epimerase